MLHHRHHHHHHQEEEGDDDDRPPPASGAPSTPPPGVPDRRHRHHRAAERAILSCLSVLLVALSSAALTAYRASPPPAPALPPAPSPGGGGGGVGGGGGRGVVGGGGVAVGAGGAGGRKLALVGSGPSATPAAAVGTIEGTAMRGGALRRPPAAAGTARGEFPASAVGRPEEYDAIDHPATEVMAGLMGKGSGPEPVRVPKFWDPPELGGADGVRERLGDGGRRLMTREEALSVGSFVPLDPEPSGGEDGGSGPAIETILVTIASYRDWQCPRTIESLYGRARYPHRIRVAVVDQTSEGDVKCSRPVRPCDDDPAQALCRYRDRIDVYEMDSDLAVGPVFARHVTDRMYRGEYFALQIDAHVSFVRDWDVDLVGQWRSANNEMAVLTVYLLNDAEWRFDGERGVSLDGARPIMCATDYDGKGPRRHLRHLGQPAGVPRITGTPTLEPYWAAGFSFSRGHFVVNVPYDQHLPMIFQGEEISITLRGFTYGYDYYTPERSVAFHSYAVGDNRDKRRGVKKFWEHGGLYLGTGTEAFKRLNGIVGMNHPDIGPSEWLHVDEERYGIGHARDVHKFFDTFGIHIDSQTVEKHLCRFAGWTMHHMFVKHLRPDGMGIDYGRIDYRFVDPDQGDKKGPSTA